jgi:hypothetical protein
MQLAACYIKTVLVLFRMRRICRRQFGQAESRELRRRTVRRHAL